MYYSRLILNPRSRKVQRDLSDPYELHRTILHGFPVGKVEVDRTTDEAAGVLYRVDPHQQSGLPILLVQSQSAPDWSFLATEAFQQYLYPIDPYQDEENPAVKERTPAIQRGQTLAFRLRANPTKRLSAGKGNKGKRVGLYDEAEQHKWLADKGQKCGFQILRAELIQGDKVQWKELREIEQRRREEHTNTAEPLPPKTGLLEVRFDGILQVTDPAAFLTAIQSGIGSGKAFGFGLLSVAPAPGGC